MGNVMTNGTTAAQTATLPETETENKSQTVAPHDSWAAYFNSKADKYADAAATWCAAAMVLSGGAALFAAWRQMGNTAQGQEVAKAVPADIPWIIMAMCAAFAVLLAALIFIVRRLAANGRKESAATSYVIDRYRLQTLRAVDAPKDLVDCLQEILHDNVEKNSTLDPASAKNFQLSVKNFKDDDPHGWFGELKQQLGANRVRELESLLLNYTRRKN